MGAALLALLARAMPDEPVLPADPREDSLDFWLRNEHSHAALGRLLDSHGPEQARELCLTKLEWRPEFLEAMLQRVAR